MQVLAVLDDGSKIRGILGISGSRIVLVRLDVRVKRIEARVRNVPVLRKGEYGEVLSEVRVRFPLVGANYV